MNIYQVISVLVALSFGNCLITAGPVIDDSKGHNENMVHSKEPSIEEALIKSLNSKCINRDISACMMLKLVTYVNRILKKSTIEIGDVEITQTSTEISVSDTSRSFNNENMSEEAQLGQVISDKLYNFVKTRSLKWKITDGTDLVISGNSDKNGRLNLGFSLRPSKNVGGDARKKGGGGGNMQALMAAAAMKIGLLKALAFKGLVLLVGKALLVSKLALVLAGIIGLKKLLHHEKHVTYEVVAHPHHEHHEHSSFSSGGDSYGGGGGGGGHGWARNLEIAQNLAYRAHIPKN